MKYRHKFLVAGGPAEGPQLPNVFHWYGEKDIDGQKYIGLIQEGQQEPAPTWFRDTTLADMFELIQ